MHIRFKNPVQKFITWLALWCVIAGMTAYAGPGESNPNNFKGTDTQRIHEAGIAAQTQVISFERTRNAELSDISIYNPEEITIGNRKVHVFDKDGIDLRQG